MCYSIVVFIVKNKEEKAMNLNLKTCIYQDNQTELLSYFNRDKFKKRGFDIVFQFGNHQDLFGYMSSNKVDIFILDTTKMDKDQSNILIQIVYQNFCKNILIITNDKFFMREGIRCLQFEENQNFQLLLSCTLFEMKSKIDSQPNRNVNFIKSKISDLLTEYCFTSKKDGFSYYTEAIYIMFLNYPHKGNMMDVYKQVGEMFSKTGFAVEKSMRSILLDATKKATLLPNSAENQKIKTLLTYDMTNKHIVSSLVSALAKEIEKCETSPDNETKCLFYQ